MGYLISDVNTLVELMYKCRMRGTYMENELAGTHNIILTDMYLFQRDEIDRLIPYLDAVLYQYGPGVEYALIYANHYLIYNNVLLTYTTT